MCHESKSVNAAVRVCCSRFTVGKPRAAAAALYINNLSPLPVDGTNFPSNCNHFFPPLFRFTEVVHITSAKPLKSSTGATR